MPNTHSSSYLETLPPLREVIADYGLQADKSLGQNFLLDGNVTQKIARQAQGLVPGFEQCLAFEVGPGPGGLTRALLASTAKSIVAIEYDQRAVKALEKLAGASQGRLQLLHADALCINLQDIAKEIGGGPEACVIIANLPYNIASKLLIQWLALIHQCPPFLRSMSLMFQKEVAQRLTAKSDSKAYGRLSIMAQWLCDVRHGFDLPARAFTPAPKVDSSVVHFIPRALDNSKPTFSSMETITKCAFSQRRKMIRSSLKEHAGILEESSIDTAKRAENLNVSDYAVLAKLLDAQVK